MSIILAFLFIAFVCKIIRFGFRITTGFMGFFTILFLGLIMLSLVSVAISMLRILTPVVLVAGIVFLIVYLIKKNREEDYYSYNDNI